jgi:hypothetical protein
MQPTPGDVHVNRLLSNVSVAFLQDQSEFIADKVFPAVPVKKQSDRYVKYDKAEWFKGKAKIRAAGSESAGGGYTFDNSPNYFCDVYAFHKDVDDDTRANQDEAIDVDSEATEFVTRDLVLKREITWAAKYFITSTWTGSSTAGDITPGTLWSAGGSTPIEDIRTQLRSVKKKTGFRANVVVMGDPVWDVLQDHPDFLERIKYTQVAIVSSQLLASVLGLANVYIGGAIQNTAIEGATDALTFLFDNDLLCVYAAPKPGLMTPSGGYTFQWSGRVGGSMRIKRFRMEPLASDRIEGEMAYDQKLVAAEMGAFFSNVIS